jgi:hypothetical protein
MLFLVALDDIVFLEQYHLGIPSYQEGIPFTRCLGKAVPMLEVSESSELGSVSASHFEYLWEQSAGREMKAGSYDRIVTSLNAKDWLTKVTQLNTQDKSELAL